MRNKSRPRPRRCLTCRKGAVTQVRWFYWVLGRQPLFSKICPLSIPGPSFILDEHPWFWTLRCAYLKCYDCWQWINKYILRLKRRQIHPQSRLQKEIRGENLKGSSCQPPGQHPLTTVNCTHPTGNTNKHTDIRPYNSTHCHRGKQSQRHASFTKSKWTSLLVLWGGGCDLEEIKLETLNFRHNHFLLLGVKSFALWSR